MPRRREGILGFDRLTGIEIADLADRLVEVWPGDGGEPGDIELARRHVDALDHNAERLARLVADLRAELARLECERDAGAREARLVDGGEREQRDECDECRDREDAGDG